MYSVILTILFSIVIIIFLKNIANLKIRAGKRKFEGLLIVILLAAIVMITLLIATKPIHYLVGILGAMTIILGFNRRGMTHKGIVVAGELSTFGYWNKIESVKILRDDNRIKLIIIRVSPLREEIQFYNLSQYKNLLTILLNDLPEEKIKGIF